MRRLAFLLFLLPAVFPASVSLQIEEQTCPPTAGIIEVLFNLPACIVEQFFNALIDGFIFGAGQFLESSLEFIVSSPDIGLFCGPYSEVMGILESLYTLAFMVVGAYFILKSHDVEGRTRAKIWLKNVFFMILALSFSFSLFGMILDINEHITTSLYEDSFDSLLSSETTLSSLVFALILAFFYHTLALMTFLTLLMRYLMIPFLLLLFPVAIFLYFLPFGREWGAFLLKFIILIVFMTSVDAVLVLAMTFLLGSGDPLLTGGFVGGFVIMLGVGLIGIVNSIIYVIATISLIMAAGRFLGSVVSLAWKAALLAALV